eukprot:CAMPEP_0180507962 /NCGR_PEP_ID=MMETSP1036_2-20121128/48904_1 /TAXON_ID=632150 /ORGANISM="Azadinium spinosum, Strain 3D9" /LENGTH=118 /DNA_ID=CAMNT_0022518209 /DNA_START=1 /DNA_END=354 /DNA_ORIENTATION=+
MFAEVRKQQTHHQPEREVVWRRIEIEEVDEIEVKVPEGVSAGQVLPVHYLGLPYKVVVPDGYGPGMVFPTTITLHKVNCEQTYLCAYCGAAIEELAWVGPFQNASVVMSDAAATSVTA